MNKVNDNLFINVANLAALFYANGVFNTFTTDGNNTNVNGEVFEALTSALDTFKIDDTLYVNPACVVSLETIHDKHILTLLGSAKLELSDAQAEAVSGISSVSEVEDIEHLTAAQLDGLKAGDRIVKVTGNEKHAYIVSYKDEVKGEISLTYADHNNVEEVYYEKTDGVWSTDGLKEITHIGA